MKALFEILKPEEPEWALAHALDEERLPAHVAVIMDGNGRWARKRHLPRQAGHVAGVNAVREVVRQACDIGLEI